MKSVFRNYLLKKIMKIYNIRYNEVKRENFYNSFNIYYKKFLEFHESYDRKLKLIDENNNVVVISFSNLFLCHEQEKNFNNLIEQCVLNVNKYNEIDNIKNNVKKYLTDSCYLFSSVMIENNIKYNTKRQWQNF